MFVYSIRSSTVKFFAFLLLTLALVVGVAVLGRGESVLASSDGVTVSYSGIKTDEARRDFIEGFGIELSSDEAEEKSFKMPDNFDRVILGYNELQKKQGLDLSKYAKKKVTRYSYKVTNYNSDEEVWANLFVFRGRIIACDLSSASPDGFVIPLTLVKSDMLK